MRKIGKEVLAEDFWAGFADDYAADMGSAYNADRLSVVRALIQPSSPRSVVDLGCGDGVLLADFPQAKVLGIEPNPALAAQARARCPAATIVFGGIHCLADIEAGSVDLLLSINVNAYFTDREDDAFYVQARRILAPGGILVITHSNELFDMFSLNAYTASFFRTHFGADVASLIGRPNEPVGAVTYNIRENPLTYARKLEQRGFAEQRRGFINFHPRPPLLGKPEGYCAASADPAERWKMMFQCSMFGVRAVRL